MTQAYYDAALSERLVTIADASLAAGRRHAAADAGRFRRRHAARVRGAARPGQPRQPDAAADSPARQSRRGAAAPEAAAGPAGGLRPAAGRRRSRDETLAPPPVFATRVAAIETAHVDRDRGRRSRCRRSAALPDAHRRSTRRPPAYGCARRRCAWSKRRRKPSVSAELDLQPHRLSVRHLLRPSTAPTGRSAPASRCRSSPAAGSAATKLVARADVERRRPSCSRCEELAALDTRSAWAELLAARAAWEASAGTVQQANRAYEIADVRYRAGVSTQLELSDSRLLLQQAEANRAQAARDLQVARARVALLPNLPIGVGGTTSAAAAAGAAATPTPAAAAPDRVARRFRNAAAQRDADTGGNSMTRHAVAGFIHVSRHCAARARRRSPLARRARSTAIAVGRAAPKPRSRRRRPPPVQIGAENVVTVKRARSSSARSSPASCGPSARPRCAPSSAARCCR